MRLGSLGIITAMSLPEEFSTKRMKASRIAESDLESVHAMLCNQKLGASSEGAPTEEKTRAYIALCSKHWDEHGFGIWSLRTKANGKFIGRAGLRRVAVDGKDEIEVSFGLVVEAWGWGMGTEIGTELATMALDGLNAPSVVGIPLTSNIQYRRVMEKIGFDFEKEISHQNDARDLLRRTKDKKIDGSGDGLTWTSDLTADESSRKPIPTPAEEELNKLISSELGGLLQEEEPPPEVK